MSTPPIVEALAASGDGRYVCPRCEGGSDRERCLSIRFDEAGGIHWRCFRASCGYTGAPRGTCSVFAGPKREARYYTRPVVPLTDKQSEFIRNKFGIDPYIIDGYDETGDRFLLGVFGPVGYNLRGYIAYNFSGDGPKSLTYNEKPDEPFMHYALAGADSIVIVEDWFSAEKVAATGEACGVAIMGTHLSQDHITELSTVAAEWGAKTYVALDQDAYTKTLLYLSKYREQFPLGLFAWSLVRDLKYESKERIKRALDGETDFIGNVKRPERV